MSAAPTDQTPLIYRLRQQLILAQVHIMETEDRLAELVAQKDATDGLLRSAQQTADETLEDNAHLERVRADLQMQYEHMRHMQHVTNEALEATRRDLDTRDTAFEELTLAANARESQLVELQESQVRLNDELEELRQLLKDREAVVSALTVDLSRIKSTRSWRWTAWLRRMAGGTDSA